MSVLTPSLPPKPPGAWLSPLLARRLATFIFLALVLIGWQVYSAYMPPVLIPSPARVFNRFIELWSDQRYIAYAITSLIHVLVGVAISFTLGVTIALVGHYFSIFDLAIYGRLTPFLNSFSGIGWAFLALIWFGVNESAVIFATSVA